MESPTNPGRFRIIGRSTPLNSHLRDAVEVANPEADVLFTEPDFVHGDIYQEVNKAEIAGGFAASTNCESTKQDGTRGKACGPADAYSRALLNQGTIAGPLPISQMVLSDRLDL